MLTLEQEEVTARQVRILAVICGALTASLPVYGALGWFLAPAQAAVVPPVMVYLLAAMAVVLLGAAPVLQKILISRSATANTGYSTQAAQAYFVSVIVSFALRDAAGTIGFVLTMLTGEKNWVLFLPIAAMATMLLDWPTRSKLLERAVGRRDSIVRR